MQAILYVAHGTRVKKGVEEAIQFLEETKEKINVSIQEIAFLELVEPDILQGIKNCVERGATNILISPILLLAAQHAKKDIPLEIAKARVIYPQLHFTLGQPLGIHDKLIETIYKRITEQEIEILPEAEVLLIGRGSSDVVVVKNMEVIASLLKKKFGFREVNTCFLYGAGLSFEEAIQYIKQHDTKQTFIVPYLLFSGLLRNGVQKKIKELELDSASIVLCASVGYDENVRDVLVERIHEVI